jgi:hypothetical protein
MFPDLVNIDQYAEIQRAKRGDDGISGRVRYGRMPSCGPHLETPEATLPLTIWTGRRRLTDLYVPRRILVRASDLLATVIGVNVSRPCLLPRLRSK